MKQSMKLKKRNNKLRKIKRNNKKIIKKTKKISETRNIKANKMSKMSKNV